MTKVSADYVFRLELVDSRSAYFDIMSYLQYKHLRIFCFFTIVIMCSIHWPSSAQSKPLAIGLEQDFLPYVTGGYYVAAWAGKSHLRARILTAHVNKPSFLVPAGFTNNIVTAYAFLGDYFIKDNFSGWHIGAGIVRWNSSIQSDARQSTVNYNNTLINGSIGYNWHVSKHFYLCPWAGLHLKVAGDNTVTVDGKSFDTSLFTPEASLKIGWYFNK